VPYSYFQLNEARLRLVPVYRDGECISANSESVRSGEYPLSRRLFVYVSATALAEPAVAAFAEYLLDEPEVIAERPQMIPAVGAEVERSRRRLEAAEDSPP
jgi:ABC-type phosphate transport system substrate-binding protein